MLYDKKSPATIEAMFSSIANDYDRVNTITSFGFHKIWNRRLIKAVLKRVTPEVHLDLCCGTGSIGVALAYKIRKKITKLHLLDFSKPMLEHALHRGLEYGLKPSQLEIHFEDAQSIPLSSNSVDSATIAYGIRNVKNPLLVIQEVNRVLKKGGIFAILELTMPTNRVVAYMYKKFLIKVLPALASLVTRNPLAYHYLSRSIQEFIPLSHLQLLAESEGLKIVKKKCFFNGVCSLLMFEKL